ncbi:MAG: hypothetical protein IT262_03515 [Saprospiraceae bacterium]|nr:hypothetical protein [Saprospiraceae bacterium]
MKRPGILLLLSTIFLFFNAYSIFSQVEFGNRLYFQNNLEQSHDGLFANVSQGSAPAELQIGCFARKRFSTHFATRVEVNLTSGLFGFNKTSYHLLGANVIPEWQISERFSIGAGLYQNVVLYDRFEYHQWRKSGVLLHVAMRFDSWEIQFRTQKSFAGNEGSQLAIGAGLAKYLWVKG